MATKLTNLNPVEVLALGKIELDKKIRAEIAPGTYDVDFAVRVRGTVGVGEDYTARISAAVPWKDMLLAALSQMAPAHRRAFVRDFLAASADGEPATVNKDAILDEVEKLAEEIVGTTERVCSGKTRASLTADAVVVERQEARVA